MSNLNQVYGKKTLLSLIVGVLLLSGCGLLPPSRPLPIDQQPALFKAPTRVENAAATASPLEGAGQAPGQVPGCTNNLQYLEDLTIPDGMQLDPSRSFDKEWRVKNNGTCHWLPAYTLRLVSGDALGASETQPLPQATAGAEAVLRISFTAPTEPGTWQGTWQAYGANDQPFGEVLTIKIVVTSP